MARKPVRHVGVHWRPVEYVTKTARNRSKWENKDFKVQMRDRRWAGERYI